MFELLPFERRDRNLVNLFDAMERSFLGDSTTGLNAFRTDILDKGDHYLLEAELPGFAKEDISLDLKGDTLVISAQHREEKEEKDEKKNYVRQERRYGSYTRSFDVTGIDAEKITAEYVNGVLRLALPKKAEEPAPAPRKITIR